MSKTDKLVNRLLSIPSDFTYTEAKALAGQFGYIEKQKGHTSGSRVLLFRESDKLKIMLHKPHPGDIMKIYAVKDFLDALKRNGDIK